ncbi:hypothetical protein TRIUR3_04018 [Triticum urartu]|uniref:Uncharacterized protein n=1 Tax=Triticum urartu TaxID=4572 RepID=M7ZA07_TRIUA|nr:hypothetical protein TRIUR3_04018 [Triticum urartu]
MAELIRLIEMQSQLSVFGGETLKLEIQWSDFPVEGIREVYVLVESLISKEERKRIQGTASSDSQNIPQFLYGLSPSQMEMFKTDDNPYNRQSKKVTEKSWIHKWEKHISEKMMIARMEREQIIWRDRIPLFGVFMHFCLLSTVFALAGNK